MNNKIIESAIDEVVDVLPESEEFKERFKAYLANRMDNNYSPNELKGILSLIDVEAEE